MIKKCARQLFDLQPYIAMERDFWKLFFSFFLKLLRRAYAKRSYLLLASLGTLFTTPLQAAEIFLLPWQVIGWDAEFSVRHREPLKTLSQQMEAAWIDNPQPSDRWFASQNQQLSSNQAVRARTLQVGAAKDPFPKALYLVPILCPLADKAVFALQLVDVESQRLLAGAHILVPQKLWAVSLQKNPPQASIADITSALQKTRDQLAAEAQRSQTEELSHAFKLLLATEGARHADEECLSLLLSHQLLPNHVQIAVHGHLQGSFLRDRLFPEKPALRATRTLKVNWGHGPFRGPRYPYTASWTESVFAGPIAPQIKGEVEWDDREQKLRLPETLLSMLEQARAALQLQDLPQVVRIDRAWAYLDRGRAYGLEMDDRLYFKDGERVVKAHVVGFYGPKLGLKNPTGQAIQEGAIVYVRKGQRALQIGDRFGFDPTRFPTAWPPVKQPAGD